MRVITFLAACFLLARPVSADRALDEDALRARARLEAGFSLKLRRLPAPVPGERELGRRLFFARELSADGALSCASCHPPSTGWNDRRPRALGRGGAPVSRNAPGLRVSGFHEKAFFWDGRAATLEAAVLDAASRPDEMDAPAPELARRLAGTPELAEAFRRVYSRPPDAAGAASAIAAFVRGAATPGETPFDRARLDPNAMSDAQKRGMVIFAGSAGCARCHSGAGFTYQGRHVLGAGGSELAFRTPSLRDLKGSAPYMHDGSLATLRDVVDFYDRGGGALGQEPRLRPLGLTGAEKDDLVAFLEALDAPDPDANAYPEEAGGDALSGVRRRRAAVERRLEAGAWDCAAAPFEQVLGRLPALMASPAARVLAAPVAEDALRYAQFSAYGSGGLSICARLRGLPAGDDPDRDAERLCREGALELALIRERLAPGPGLAAACRAFQAEESPEFGATGAAELCDVEARHADDPAALCGELVPRWLDASWKSDCVLYFDRFRALRNGERRVCEGIGMRGGLRLDDCHGMVAYAEARRKGAAACGASGTCRVLLGAGREELASLGGRVRAAACAASAAAYAEAVEISRGELRGAETGLAQAEANRAAGDRAAAAAVDEEAEKAARLSLRFIR